MHAAANTFPFNLRVVEARGLHSTKRDIADPFVVVKLKGLKHLFNSEKQSTEVQMNRENPVFNQDFLLHPKENDTILVKVMDKNTPLNRKLGKVLIPVNSHLNRGVVDSWYPLEGKTERAGEVRLLINFGSKAFTGFHEYLSSHKTSHTTGHGTTHTTGHGTTGALPAVIAHGGHSEGTTVHKETVITKEAVVPKAVPVVPVVPVVAPVVPVVAPVVPMANLNLGAPATTTIHADAVHNVSVARDTVIQERIHPVEEEIVQPVIHRERQQTEIHRVQQDINESQVLPTVYQEKTLAAEYRGDHNVTRDFLAEENNTRSTVVSTRDVDATRHTKVVNAPIVEETIKKTVIEVVQPVIHRETTAPVVIRETLPIYEKVIEAPIIINDVRTVQQTVNVQTVQTTTVQPVVVGSTHVSSHHETSHLGSTHHVGTTHHDSSLLGSQHHGTSVIPGPHVTAPIQGNYPIGSTGIPPLSGAVPIGTTAIGGNVPLHQTYHNEHDVRGIVPGTVAHQTENRFEGHNANVSESVVTKETIVQPGHHAGTLPHTTGSTHHGL